MDKQDFDIKKYPKSKNKLQCLGPCYHPGTMVVHPTQLEIVSDYDQPFCPVNEWKQIDPKTGRETENITDGCFNPTEKTNISNKELQLNILTPHIDFNVEHFLKIYYNIYSFEDSIDWLDRNGHTALGTRIRIMNCSLKAFGESIDLFDNRFADFFIEYVKKNDIRNFYNKISGYVGINSEKNSINLISKDKNKLSNNEFCIERINYIIKTFLEKDDIIKFLVKYFKNRKSQWKDIDNHLKNMSNDLIGYILNKITITLQK